MKDENIIPLENGYISAIDLKNDYLKAQLNKYALSCFQEATEGYYVFEKLDMMAKNGDYPDLVIRQFDVGMEDESLSSCFCITKPTVIRFNTNFDEFDNPLGAASDWFDRLCKRVHIEKEVCKGMHNLGYDLYFKLIPTYADKKFGKKISKVYDKMLIEWGIRLDA